MNAPKIEKNVPMAKGAIDKYRWLDEVEKGDSFLWPSSKLPNLINLAASGLLISMQMKAGPDFCFNR